MKGIRQMEHHNGPIATATGTALRDVEEQLISAIASCEADVRRGAEDLARLKDALRSLRRERRGTVSVAPSKSGFSRQKTRERSNQTGGREREGSAASAIRSFVREVLWREGRRLNRAEILELMNQAGIKIQAKVPIKRIAKVMWSSKEFVNVGDGYWIAGERIPNSQDKDST
jgi:hypothetical protein